MDTLDNYRQIIEKILTEYAQLPYAHGELERQLIIDKNATHYLLITLGWENKQRVHGCLVHIDIINDKIWIQRDGTEDGIANEFVSVGIPKDRIVLAFQPTEVRKYTDFAVI
ncbi:MULTISPECIES: XisI protein [unclassified Nostoc]|uniref:XisI protein n=1 Tax=unclassified Nostoc TaxID=2593658 RepID=UPI002AD4DB26|nr:XisI protein [Nostoc sp. DedQUE03]MDZ7972778.1 XisI protein [Nostoc sp. DedQUE03]MDZ8046142.1 XisI protein [Nostoc sp. DedQUE02]